MSLVDFQIYPEEYFSGSDVSIYFGDVWVDEIVSLNFTLQEFVQPIFGYNSYVYDAAPRGARIIQGNFRINFKESFYLHKIIQEIAFIEGQMNMWETYSADRVEADDLILNHIVNKITLKKQFEALSSDQIYKIAKRIQDAAWDKKKGVYPSTRKPFFGQPVTGFDIVILYGSRLQATAGIPDLSRRYGVPSSTTYTLSGVQLNSLGHVITPDGAPVYEDFSFIARDLDHGQQTEYDTVIDDYNLND